MFKYKLPVTSSRERVEFK